MYINTITMRKGIIIFFRTFIILMDAKIRENLDGLKIGNSEDDFYTTPQDFINDIDPNEINVFSATCGPGLIGSLLVGSTFTKSLAISFQKPFIPINHLEGHILSTSFNNDIKFPSLVLLLTGGHTQVYLMKDERNIELLGQSIDDAIGEAFDKTAKLIGLSYPGGAEIEREAVRGDENRFILPKPLAKEKNFNF